MYDNSFSYFGRPPVPDDSCKGSAPKVFSVLEEKIFKGFYHIWAWRPSWSTDRDHFSNFSFPHPKEPSYEIWAKLAQRLQRRIRLKMLMDGRTDGRTKSDHNSSSWAELRTKFSFKQNWTFITEERKKKKKKKKIKTKSFFTTFSKHFKPVDLRLKPIVQFSNGS